MYAFCKLYFVGHVLKGFCLLYSFGLVLYVFFGNYISFDMMCILFLHFCTFHLFTGLLRLLFKCLKHVQMSHLIFIADSLSVFVKYV